MAILQSPGVQVQVIDESFYTPAAPSTTPMLFVASAQDKTNPSGNLAQGTTAENAGKVWLITSQRDLVDTFGTPLFPTDASGNPRHGDEQNEYGLQAAYSVLGVTARAYIVRADLDLNQLSPSSSIPQGDPVGGTYWVDSNSSKYGVKEWNATTKKFTSKTPLILDDTSSAENFDGVAPAAQVGDKGDYCMVVTKDNLNTLYVKNSSGEWQKVTNDFCCTKKVFVGPHVQNPTFDFININAETGSVWVTTTVPTNGADWDVKYFNSQTRQWTPVDAPIYDDSLEALKGLDPANGGKNIPQGALYIDSDPLSAEFTIYRRSVSGATSFSVQTTAMLEPGTTSTFTIQESVTNSSVWSSTTTVAVSTNNTATLGSLVAGAINATGLTSVSATWVPSTNTLTVTHRNGGEMLLDDGDGTPLTAMGVTSSVNNVYDADGGTLRVSTWKPLVYEARPDAPSTDAADGRLWYDVNLSEVDILEHDGNTWVGYRNAWPNTDPAGPIVSAVEPTEQSDGTALVDHDIWVDTSNPDQIGRNIYIYDSGVAAGSKWVKQDVTDQSTPDGWLFADARWGDTGEVSPSDKVDVETLLTSDYLDPDAPDPALYPRGMKLWNTRRSGWNVKKFVANHIDIFANEGVNIRYNDEDMGDYVAGRWVAQYPVAEDGGPQFGRLAQRAQVVNALKQAIDENVSARDTDTLVFNLIATPGYPEAIQNMIAFNVDRKETAFVVGDTPFRLEPTGTKLNEWSLNMNLALDNGDNGAVSYSEYMGMWYPSGYTNDNTGNYIVVPPSHMMLRTIVNSDNKSYQWFAPAGLRRGGIDNATSVGYITGEGEFKPVALYEGLRDVLYNGKVNPIATLTGAGLVAWGQKTRARAASALDRVNVARLVVYLRRQLDIMARPFLFEPNDAQTRREIKAAADSLLLELVGLRALYDFITVCDESNNTPARIDRNELWLDIAIEPVKAVEFIYIPLRIKNTGDIAAGL